VCDVAAGCERGLERNSNRGGQAYWLVSDVVFINQFFQPFWDLEARRIAPAIVELCADDQSLVEGIQSSFPEYVFSRSTSSTTVRPIGLGVRVAMTPGDGGSSFLLGGFLGLSFGLLLWLLCVFMLNR
jgi:hypothetical protein